MNELMDDDDKMMSKKQKSSADSNTPVLDNFSRDLNKLAEAGKLDPVIGREREILRIAQILSRRKKNNPIIIGEPGCGKTALVEGLAIKIVNGDCPKNLIDKRIVNLDLTSVVAGTKYRGQFEERMKVIIEELQANPNIIVFIDEIHTLVGSGNSSGSMDGSNIFKPALARGELQCIGATTLDEFRKNIEKDGALERRFQKVIVEPSSVAETIQILKNVREKYESFHNVTYTDEVIETCVKLADRYITDREFPDKAFDILDEVGARMQTELKVPEIIEELKKKAADIKQQKINNGDKVIVEFWAEWCGPCKMMKPVFERVSNSNENGDVQMYTMNIDLNKEVGASLGIRSIPTIKVFNNGSVIDTKVGMLSETSIKGMVTELING